MKAALNLDALRVLRAAEVSALLGVNRRTLHRWQAAGLMPARRQVGPAVAGWLAADLGRWLQSRPVAKGARAGR